MCSRDCSTAMCWKWSIFAGSTRLKTPPTPAFASASVICPSDSSCSCWSFSPTVILLSRRSTLRSMPRSALCRAGANALSSLERVAATTPPATSMLSATIVAMTATLRPRGPMTLPPWISAAGPTARGTVTRARAGQTCPFGASSATREGSRPTQRLHRHEGAHVPTRAGSRARAGRPGGGRRPADRVRGLRVQPADARRSRPATRRPSAADFTGHPLSGPTARDDDAGPVEDLHLHAPGTYAYYCQVHVRHQRHARLDHVSPTSTRPACPSASARRRRAGQPVTFTYTGSADPDGTLTSWNGTSTATAPSRRPRPRARRRPPTPPGAPSPSACTRSTTAASRRPRPSRP